MADLKILLCGEYSGVHSELAAALRKKGHSVDVMSDGDGYKGFSSDIKVVCRKKRKGVLAGLFSFLLDVFGLAGLVSYIRFDKSQISCDYDVVQIINPVVINGFGALGNFLFIRFLRGKGRRFFMCGLGEDYRWVLSCLKGKFRYSTFDRFSLLKLRRYYSALRYVFNPAYVFLCLYAERVSSCIFVGLEDYKIAYSGVDKVSFIRIPLSPDKLKKPEEKKFDDGSVYVFHAWQEGKELKKGNDILHEAVLEVLRRYGDDKVTYKIASGMPYDEFVNSYDCCDIYLDQVYSYDRGVSGALGMAAGKVVFSGFELIDVYSSGCPSSVKNMGVNASPDVDELVQAFSYLIENPKAMKELRDQAFRFAKENYDSGVIADEYLRVWAGFL